MNRVKAIEFFMQIVLCNAKHVAIENPRGIMTSVYRKPDQIIEPWMFGDEVQKATCLWLKNLPLLKQTVLEKPEIEYIEWERYDGLIKKVTAWDYEILTTANNQEERSKLRSKTFNGVAEAMATQWGEYCES